MLTIEVHTTIVRALRAGSYLPEAAGMAGVAERTVYQWLQKGNEALGLAEDEATEHPQPDETPEVVDVDPDHPYWLYAQFAQAVMEARAEAKVEAVATIRAAIQGAPAVFDKDGNEVRAETPKEWRAALAFLERTDTERWGRTWRRGDEREKATKADAAAIEDQVGSTDDEKLAALAGIDDLEEIRERHRQEAADG